MARVPYLKRNDLAEADRAAYDRIEKSRGNVGFIWQALLNTPNICDRMLALADELRHGTVIDKSTRELAVLIVGQGDQLRLRVRPSLECGDKGRHPARASRGIGRFRNIAALHRRGSRGDAVREGDDARPGTVKDATWEALRKSLRHPAGDGNSAAPIAWYNMVVRILLPLNIQNEPDFKRL